MTDALNLLDDLLNKAKKAGADAADAVYAKGTSLSLAYRLGEPEHLERAEGEDVGLRVLMGKRQAIVSSSDVSSRALDALAERAVQMARLVPEDEFLGLAEPGQLARDLPSLDMCDPKDVDEETLTRWAKVAEEAARAVDGVTNSEGAEAGWGKSEIALAATNGFAHGYENSHAGFSASVLAGEGTAMERDYDYTSAVYAQDLRDPAEVGRAAGEKAVKRLGARKAKSAKLPMVFDPRVSRSMLNHLASAINGAAVARGTSFLKDKMDALVFGEHITVIDDPHRHRGLRSKPFDGEGLANKKREVISDGRLTTWIMDLRSARKLGLESTGHAARATSSVPSPAVSNFYMAPGDQTPKELISDIKEGFYVTEMMGFGVNGTTGDYSRGASGFWIENGEIVYPVSEVTIAGNLKDMFKNLTPADDLTFKYGIDAPTIRIEGMTVAGQ